MAFATDSPRLDPPGSAAALRAGAQPTSSPKDLNRPRTMFLVVDSGTAIRNILRTEVFAILRSVSSLRIVIFSPLNDAEFQAEFAGENIFFEFLPQWRPNFLVKTLRSMRKDIWGEKFDLVRFREKRESRQRRFLRQLALRCLVPNRTNDAIDEALLDLEKWEARFTPRLAKKHYDKYQPDLVFYTTLYSKDQAIEFAARQRGIKTAAFILSWDNPTTKGPFPVKPDRAILWNEIMRDELLKYHGFRPEQLFVSGPPQFDLYARREGYASRESFFTKWKLDPAKKLITYTTGTPGTAPFDDEIVDLLYQKMIGGAFKEPCQLLVRLHPKDVYSVYKRFEGKPDLVLQLPGRRAKTNDSWNPSREDMYGLAELMDYSDVVVNIASTTTIDAAALDTPVVNVAFDGYKAKPYAESCLRYYDYEHYKRVVDTGGLKISRNLEELVVHIQQYLDNPNLDAEGRARIRQEQCYKLDGQASRRIAEFLLEFIQQP